MSDRLWLRMSYDMSVMVAFVKQCVYLDDEGLFQDSVNEHFLLDLYFDLQPLGVGLCVHKSSIHESHFVQILQRQEHFMLIISNRILCNNSRLSTKQWVDIWDIT